MQLLALAILRELRRGYPTALLAELGIPPLQMQQTLELTQLHYRLRVSAPQSFQHYLFRRGTTGLKDALQKTFLDYRMIQATALLDPDRMNLESFEYNDTGAEGAGRPEGVLGQCSSFAELDLRSFDIGEDTVARLRSSTRCTRIHGTQLGFLYTSGSKHGSPVSADFQARS